jgi:ABC-type molybdenum transport system ATPase subunit/photorepair protein PhrA
MNPQTTTNGVLVDLDGIEKVFHRGSEDIHVLSDLHLKVPKGEFLALMGPSGSGKSTLLNLIGGLDRPTRGTVSIAGDRVDELSDRQLAAWRARHIGFVFQLYNLLPVLTAERNVELPLLLTHLSKAERKHHVATALAVVGLSHRTKHYPRQLSGGAWALLGRLPPTRPCCCAMSRQATWIASPATKSWICSRRSIASTARPSSWSHTIRTPRPAPRGRSISTKVNSATNR